MMMLLAMRTPLGALLLIWSQHPKVPFGARAFMLVVGVALLVYGLTDKAWMNVP